MVQPVQPVPAVEAERRVRQLAKVTAAMAEGRWPCRSIDLVLAARLAERAAWWKAQAEERRPS